MKYWIWLSLAFGIGTNGVSEILKKYKTAQNFYEHFKNGEYDYSVFSKSRTDQATKIDLSKADLIIEECKKSDIRIITPENESYPKRLSVIANPPYVLYCKGGFPDFDNLPTVCIVGPRKVSEFGYKSAYSLAGRISRAGFIIVSGGAIGSDYAAHIGALYNGGRTVAVLPCGINYDYLKQNAELRKAIAEKGALISECPPDYPVYKNSFQIRNRLLSALSVGTVIVEAPYKSGSLITAKYALEQGKDIFVIPGNPSSENYKGSNLLLRDGAKPLLDAGDVINEYLFRYPDKIDIEKAYEKPLKKIPQNNFERQKEENQREKPKSEEKNEKILPETISKNARIVYNELNMQFFSCEDLSSCGIDAENALAVIGELEIYGLIKPLPGGRYEMIK